MTNDSLKKTDFLVLIALSLSSLVRTEPSPYDLLFACIIVMMLLRIMLNRRMMQTTPYFILMSVLGLTNLLSVFNSVDYLHSVRYALITLYLVLTSMALVEYMRSKTAAKLVVTGYVVGAMLAACLGLLGFVGGGFGQLFMYNSERVSAYFKDPNVFAAYMVPPILFFGGMIVRRTADRRRYFSMSVFLGLLVAAFFFAYSRAAYLNMTVAALTYVIILALKRRISVLRKLMLSYVIAAAVTITLTISLAQVPTLLQRLQVYQEYDAVRFEVQGQVLPRIIGNGTASSSLWLGIGPGEFETMFSYASHSLYLRAISENGILGFGSLALLIILSLSKSFHTVRATKEHECYSSEILAALVGTLVNSLFIDSLHWRHFWVLIALAWVPAANVQNTTRSPLNVGLSFQVFQWRIKAMFRDCVFRAPCREKCNAVQHALH